MAARSRAISAPTPCLDFVRACTELADARRRQLAKDTPAHRSAVLDSRTRIDAVLDRYLLMGRAG